MSLTRCVRGAAGLAVALALAAATAARADERVQPPELAAPQRGSLAGQLGSVAFDTADLRRGSFSLPSPFAAPEARGPLQADVFPSYSPDNGISEWGQGWRTNLAITRFRISGTIDYHTDDLSSPWGQLRRGSDGYWYPLGLSARVRVEQTPDGLYAYLPDGHVLTFGAAGEINRSQGVYAWYLTQVDSSIGQRTSIHYQVNALGRPFVTEVLYGGRGDDYQYRIDFSYQPVPLLFFDYASGAELGLDQRVQAVVVSAKNTQTGQFELRWRYDLIYQDDGVGPAFYLAEVDQTFAAGDNAPPVRYGYQLASAAFPDLTLRPVPKLDPLLEAFGDDIIQPSASTIIDIDHDGRPDLEEHSAQMLLHQGSDGFDYESLPTNPDAYAPCRFSPSTQNLPRTLAEMRAGEDEYQVVVLEPDAIHAHTELTVCDRAGTFLDGQSLDGYWPLDANTRLVDLDRDQQPDLVHVDYGWLSVIPNESDATAFRFGAARGQVLQPAFIPTASWIHDFNGDGLADVVARSGSLVTVWFGKGNLEFDPAGQTYDLRTISGGVITDLDDYEFTFFDANRDGLTDLLLTKDYAFYLLVNNGYFFQQVVIPALDYFDAYYSRPVVADLGGSGNAELTFTRLGHAYGFALDAPGTGLMTSVDDGKGNVLRFGYQRAPAESGLRQRSVVLASLDIESSGYDPLHYAYTYGAPRLQSVARFLLGFGEVARHGPTVVHDAVYSNDDDVQGVLLSSSLRDSLQPDVVKRESHEYDRVSSFGVPWLRPKVDRTGWSNADGSTSIEETTTYLSYGDEVCPTLTEHVGAAGTLTTETTYAHLAAFTKHLACYDSDVVRSGRHDNTQFDFRQEERIDRNAAGLVEKVTAVGGAGPLLLQQVTYNSDYTVATMSSPATGVSQFEWDPQSKLLSLVAAPDGTLIMVGERDSRTDNIRALVTRHGALSYTQWYRFDGQERLSRSWDSLGQGSEANPDQTYAYRFATAEKPSALTMRTLVDASAASAVTTVDLGTATGEALTSARLLGQSWVFDEVVTRSRARAEVSRSLRDPVAAATDVGNMDLATLFGGLHQIADEHQAAFGGAVDSLTRFDADVARTTRSTMALSGGALVQRQVENDARTTVRTFDADEHLTSFVDEERNGYGYRYDALGRLRVVILPDGTTHRIDLDEYGHRRRISRDGVATIDYEYDATTGLPTTVRFSTPAGQAIRSVRYTYDTAGRKTSERDDDRVGSTSETFAFYYDGASPERPNDRSTPGLLTAVSGDGFVKRIDYRADAKPLQQSMELTGWRTVEARLDYAENGALRGRTVTLRGPDGGVLSTFDLHDQYGADGQLASMLLNGKPLASLSYDANGQPESVALPNGESATFAYDPLTRAPIGFAQRTNTWTTEDRFKRNDRGAVGTELLSLGNQSVTRTYTYSPRGFLIQSADASANYGYGYDAIGLPNRIIDPTSDRVLQRAGQVLSAGAVQYQLDGLGRTVARDDLQLRYGPDGQIRDAQRGDRRWSYRYDENGQRLLKLVGGEPVAAYIADGYLDGNGLVVPVRIAGRIVGVVRGGAFTPVPLDHRGTVLGDSDGTARLPSPFGDRAAHPDSAAVLDYVTKGYDADLGTIRMGVRDYDARISQFLTPDPLFLASPDECLNSPVECNLYGYARNAPGDFVDPSGRQSVEAFIAVSDYAKSQMAPQNRDRVNTAQIKIALSVIAAYVIPRPVMYAIGLGTLATARNEKDPAFGLGVLGILGGAGRSMSVLASREAELYRQATEARDEVVRAFRLLPKNDLRQVATVVGAYNRETGAIGVGTKFFDRLEFCGEDVAFANAGADSKNVVLTPAIRPSRPPGAGVVEPCLWCRVKYDQKNFGFRIPPLMLKR